MKKQPATKQPKPYKQAGSSKPSGEPAKQQGKEIKHPSAARNKGTAHLGGTIGNTT